MVQRSSGVTECISRWRSGDAHAGYEALMLLDRELRTAARALLDRERNGHTLQPTALVHEAILRLTGAPMNAVNGREHLMALASRSMRQILINHAQRRRTAKRGGTWRRVPLCHIVDAYEQQCGNITALHEALLDLERHDARQARVVELRFFGGLTTDEIASAMGLSSRTVEREWTMARAWLRREIQR